MYTGYMAKQAVANIRIRPDVKKRLKVLASKEGLTLSEMIKILIGAYQN